mmetsp:Transcript_23300/g.26827  ORF Transcript_23300/g.26827 Transcript_23300/m.26827 type:complete len:115 (-) Transcript_23300:220-564(-)
MDDCVTHDDLFLQTGTWETVHIETPLISFIVEYRQSNGEAEGCNFQSLDAWITDASPEILEETWEGILGETRLPKFYADGNHILNDRGMILLGKGDCGYEINEESGVDFGARLL